MEIYHTCCRSFGNFFGVSSLQLQPQLVAHNHAGRTSACRCYARNLGFLFLGRKGAALEVSRRKSKAIMVQCRYPHVYTQKKRIPFMNWWQFEVCCMLFKTILVGKIYNILFIRLLRLPMLWSCVHVLS